MEGGRQPLLSPQNDHQNRDQHLRSTNSSIASSFTPDPDDIPLINSVRDFSIEFCRESKKLWYLAGPAIFTTLCQYSLGAITQLLAGHVGTLDLAAVSVENSVIAGFSFGIMVYN
jgi:MATE family multidrug resistance protein